MGQVGRLASCHIRVVEQPPDPSTRQGLSKGKLIKPPAHPVAQELITEEA